MPKLFVYRGITLFFYSNEHEPIHVHAHCQGNEIKIIFHIKEGKIVNVQYKTLYGKFSPVKMKQLKRLISTYKMDIVKYWVDFFILKKQVPFHRINKRL